MIMYQESEYQFASFQHSDGPIYFIYEFSTVRN
jgi:hypothetical protein